MIQVLKIFFFHFIPQFIHFIQREVMKDLIFGGGSFFHTGEALYKFLIGPFKGVLSIYLQKPCKVYYRKKHIAQFILDFFQGTFLLLLCPTPGWFSPTQSPLFWIFPVAALPLPLQVKLWEHPPERRFFLHLI